MVVGGGAVSYERGTPVLARVRVVEEARTFLFENSHFTEVCSGSEAGSYFRLIDFVYHSTLGLIVKKQKRKHLLVRRDHAHALCQPGAGSVVRVGG